MTNAMLLPLLKERNHADVQLLYSSPAKHSWMSPLLIFCPTILFSIGHLFGLLSVPPFDWYRIMIYVLHVYNILHTLMGVRILPSHYELYSNGTLVVHPMLTLLPFFFLPTLEFREIHAAKPISGTQLNRSCRLWVLATNLNHMVVLQRKCLGTFWEVVVSPEDPKGLMDAVDHHLS